MNEYLGNLNKIEFVITYACTGKCKHCSEGDHALCGEHIDGEKAADAVRKICALYPIETVMTFGGEPLLYSEAVFKIHSAARACGVAKRQVITNGYFSQNPERIAEVAEGLFACGVNEILLSVDAFHQETIPLEAVKSFALAVQKKNNPILLSPAWLVSREHDNPYNEKTRKILLAFEELGFAVGEGNVIFPEGNAKRYLSNYFTSETPQNPYVENPKDLRCVSVAPDGGLVGGNLYRQDITDILNHYTPMKWCGKE